MNKTFADVRFPHLQAPTCPIQVKDASKKSYPTKAASIQSNALSIEHVRVSRDTV